MSFLGARNSISLGVSPHAVLSNGPILNRLAPSLLLQFAGAETLDPRITFSRASNATRFDSAGTLVTMGNNEPRFDYNPVTLAPRGLLIEEQRVNSIRNNTMQGAVAGTPGTLPTNWPGTAGAGTLVQEIVGTGTDAGIAYIDYRLSGTTSTTAFSLFFEAQNQIVATSGQTWSTSFYVKLQAGSTTNITTTRCSTRGNQGSTIRESSNTNFTPTAVFQRVVNTYTLADALTDRVNGFLNLVFASGVAIDITFRIGLPQLELGAFATSVIPTTGTAATRVADAASMTGTNFSSWYNATEGTWFADFIPATSDYLSNKNLFLASDNTTSNFNGLRYVTAGSRPGLGVTTAGTTQASLATTAMVANTAYKMAGAYKLNDFAVSRNGAAVVTDTSGTIPTVTQAEIGTLAGLNVGTQHILRLAYYPRRLSNAELQGITS